MPESHYGENDQRPQNRQVKIEDDLSHNSPLLNYLRGIFLRLWAAPLGVRFGLLFVLRESLIHYSFGN